MFPIYDPTNEDDRAGLKRRLESLRAAADPDGQWATLAADLVRDTRERGDAALVEHMQQFTDPDYPASRMRVTPQELAAADKHLTGELRGAIEQAISNVYAYQKHIKPKDADPVWIAEAELGLRWTPITPVGLLVPGGSAVLFSSLIMLAVPAMVAGVKPEDITVVTPPPYRKDGEPAKDISPITLAVANILGLSKVYRIGGPPAVAALAYGTD
ncbi:MAG: histidinol dehydrogenase, partial [Planctomycetota bacterium]